MGQSYRAINSELVGRIKLVMTDVDGTLTSKDDSISPAVTDNIRRLEETGVMVGLVSGRSLPGLESLASDFGISGPVIAENGGVAKLKGGGDLVDMGYSREPALEALRKLKALYPDAIQERDSNKYRLVDVVINTQGVDKEKVREHLEREDAELIDSGYILHLMQRGISKGKTLMNLLDRKIDGHLSADNVMVFGDSLTDLSLFERFPHSVLIPNPRIPVELVETLRSASAYESELPLGDGFAQVASYMADIRSGNNSR